MAFSMGTCHFTPAGTSHAAGIPAAGLASAPASTPLVHVKHPFRNSGSYHILSLEVTA